MRIPRLPGKRATTAYKLYLMARQYNAMGNSRWVPNSFDSFSIRVGGDGFSVQILWGARIDHGDHVHVGIEAL